MATASRSTQPSVGDLGGSLSNQRNAPADLCGIGIGSLSALLAYSM